MTTSASGSMQQRSHAWLALVGWIGLAALAGLAGGIASLDAVDFYRTLTRPGWAPPGWLFGPVWSVLYVLMGIAAWLVWRVIPSTDATRMDRRRGLSLFVAQLVLNALWTWLFFAWRQGAAAFVEIVVLWLMVLATAVYFGRVRSVAAWLLVPYLAWVAFATALTWAIWHRNPGQL